MNFTEQTPPWWNGRHKGLKIPRSQKRTSSSLVGGTKHRTAFLLKAVLCFFIHKTEIFTKNKLTNLCKNDILFIVRMS